jgi:hypothetical protein
MQLTEQLNNGIVEITFTKVDGSERIMKCTLQKEYIDANYEVPEKKTDRVNLPKEGILVVFDTENNGWRSIRSESIISWH